MTIACFIRYEVARAARFILREERTFVEVGPKRPGTAGPSTGDQRS